MRILFAAHEDSWGGFFGLIRAELPEHTFVATGRFGLIAGAGLDVFWEEPPDPEDPIFSYNVLATPHIGGSTDVSVRGIVEEVAENIRRLESNLQPLHLRIQLHPGLRRDDV